MFMQQLSWKGNEGEDDEGETNEGAFQMDDDLGMRLLHRLTRQGCPTKKFKRVKPTIRSRQRKQVIPVPSRSCSWSSSNETR